MEQTRKIRFAYGGIESHICCPANANYEEVIKIAMEHFLIPMDYRNRIQVYAGSYTYGFIIDKKSFDNYPNPNMLFVLRMEILENRNADIYIQVPMGADEERNDPTLTDRECMAEYNDDQPNVKRFKAAATFLMDM